MWFIFKACKSHCFTELCSTITRQPIELGTKGFKQFSSSISWRVVAFRQNDQGYLLWNLNIYPIFCLWAIILAPDKPQSQSGDPKTQMIA